MQHADDLSAQLRAYPALPERLSAARPDAAEWVTGELFQRHPDLLARFGERGRTFTREDIGFHVASLAGAIAGWSPTAFEDYVRWSVRVLRARGMQPPLLGEALSLIDEALQPGLTGEEHRIVASLLALGSVACLQEPALPATSQSAPGQVGPDPFLEMVLQGRRAEALRIASDALSASGSLLDAYLGVLQEALYEVDRLWEANRITVGVEHMATAIVQYVAARLTEQVTAGANTQGKIVIAGVQGYGTRSAPAWRHCYWRWTAGPCAISVPTSHTAAFSPFSTASMPISCASVQPCSRMSRSCAA